MEYVKNAKSLLNDLDTQNQKLKDEVSSKELEAKKVQEQIQIMRDEMNKIIQSCEQKVRIKDEKQSVRLKFLII